MRSPSATVSVSARKPLRRSWPRSVPCAATRQYPHGAGPLPSWRQNASWLSPAPKGMATMADLLSDNPDVMGALLAALCDPGRFTDRAPHEPMSWWQRRAVIEHAAPYIAAAERERIRQMAIRTRAACYGDGGHSFADLLGPDAAGTGPQS